VGPAPASVVEVTVSPSIDEVRAAAVRLDGRIVTTPMIEAETAGDTAGRLVLVKAEVLQRTGSFKIRGALTFLGLLDDETRGRGVVAYSSGNHAQGVAAAAAAFGVSATIVMPITAPEIKVRRTRRWGAEVVAFDPQKEDRRAIAGAIAEELGATVLPPYDHPWTITGQATLGLEVARQCSEANVEAPSVLVPTGGGGLCAGVAIALSEVMPSARVFAVEPSGFDDHRLSLEAGERVPAAEGAVSICDALLSPIPGEITFPINQRLLAGAMAVTDDEVRAAMRHAFEELKLVVEPGGAVGLAAVLSGKVDGDGPVVVVLSGGNIDIDTLAGEVGTGS
jgi:threonine dehydratase